MVGAEASGVRNQAGGEPVVEDDCHCLRMSERPVKARDHTVSHRGGCVRVGSQGAVASHRALEHSHYLLQEKVISYEESCWLCCL